MTTAWCYTINIWPCVCVLYIYFLYIWFYFNCDECIWFLVHLLKVILMKSTVQEEKKVDWNICLIWWWWSSDTLFAWLYFFKKSCWMLAPSFWTGIWWISKEKKVKFAPPPFFWLLYFVIWTVHPHSIDVITHCMRLQPTTSVISFYFFLKFPSPNSGQPWSTAPPLFSPQDRLSQYTCWKSCAPPPISFFACSSRLYLTRQLPSWILADTLTASRGLYGGIVT